MNFTCNTELTINNLFSIVISYGLDDRSLNPGKDKILLLSTESRPTLGPTSPPIQRVLEGISPGVKRLGREADNSLLYSAEVHYTVCLHDIVIN
jgi:hypothetical protein